MNKTQNKQTVWIVQVFNYHENDALYVCKTEKAAKKMFNKALGQDYFRPDEPETDMLEEKAEKVVQSKYYNAGLVYLIKKTVLAEEDIDAMTVAK